MRVSFDQPEYTADAVATGTLRLLEAVRDYAAVSGKAVKIYQAGSSEMFGAAARDCLAAAKVGGILANSAYPAEFIYDNPALQTTPQPIREDQLLTGTFESTNEWYAIAKVAGIKLAQAYRVQYGFNAISAMPTNLYGPGDNLDLKNSHVIPALLRQCGDRRRRDDPRTGRDRAARHRLRRQDYVRPVQTGRYAPQASGCGQDSRPGLASVDPAGGRHSGNLSLVLRQPHRQHARCQMNLSLRMASMTIRSRITPWRQRCMLVSP